MAEEDSAPLPPPKPTIPTSKTADPRKKELAQKLWERLAKSRPGPDNKDLLYLARFVPLLSSGALKTLFTRPLNTEELRELIQHVPKAREPAVKLYLQRGVDAAEEEDLRFILSHAASKDIAKVLLKRFPTDANLVLVERTVEELKEVVQRIRKQELTTAVMREIDRVL
ncbi:MAG: hypothetical protein KDA89_11460 [Planctomycetaceae bacterium]|nr:hypothetical protein [Planctomycetaceae bacterium]